MKYKVTKETKEYLGRTLHRIVCVTAFANVAAGDLGGWVEDEKNLSQSGNAWVSGNAQVYGYARVSGNALVYGYAQVYGDAWVSGNALVYGYARVSGNAWVSGDAQVYGDAWVYGDARVYGDAWVYGNAQVYGDAWVSGNAQVYGYAQLSGNALVKKTADYIVLKNNWSSGRHFTYTLSNKMWKVGCFYGSGEELIKKALSDSELSGKCYEAAVRYVEALEKIQAENY